MSLAVLCERGWLRNQRAARKLLQKAMCNEDIKLEIRARGKFQNLKIVRLRTAGVAAPATPHEEEAASF